MRAGKQRGMRSGIRSGMRSGMRSGIRSGVELELHEFLTVSEGTATIHRSCSSRVPWRSVGR
jgi:hypothetical protein